MSPYHVTAMLDEAVSTLEAALAVSTETGSCFWEAEQSAESG